jgi:Protein of unknown function (DUF3160)
MIGSAAWPVLTRDDWGPWHELRGLSWNASEEELLRSFGQTLGQIMLYENNSSLSPRDDAPRITDILTLETSVGTLEYLHVGVGRPRAIYLLYPWHGRPVFCRGAVLPYFEFRSRNRLTDELWRATLDAAEPPSPPEWLAPILATKRPLVTRD